MKDKKKDKQKQSEVNLHDGTIQNVQYEDGRLNLVVDLPADGQYCDITASGVSAYVKNDYADQNASEMDLATIILDFEEISDPDEVPDDELKQLTSTDRAEVEDIKEQMRRGNRTFFRTWETCGPHHAFVAKDVTINPYTS